MARSMTLPTVGALALLGVATGLHLGQSAIAEINPVHFSPEKPSNFYADLTPGGRQGSPQQRLAGASGSAGGAECIGCRTFPEEYFPEHDPSVDFPAAPEPGAASDFTIELASTEMEPAEEVARRRAGLDQVERYARAPVTLEEERALAQTVEAPVAEQSAPVAE